MAASEGCMRLLALFSLLCTLLVGSGADHSGNLPASGTAMDETAQNRPSRERCCRREPHFVALGYDPTGNAQVIKDIGRCVRSCAGLRGRPEVVTCNRHSKCYPSRVLEETVSLENGTVDVSIIDECNCENVRNSPCALYRQDHVYYAGTAFQRTLDQGVCLGQPCAGAHHGCHASARKTTSIRGPNGKRCVKITENCTCSSGCLRQPFKVPVLASVQERDTATGDIQLINRTQLIDVGVCGGQCPIRTGRRCFGGTSSCLYYQTNPGSCYPTKTDTVPYTSAHTGKLTHLIRIKECACSATSPSLQSNFRKMLLENTRPASLN